MSSASHDVRKKTYGKPSLRIYGKIEGLTASVSNTSMTGDGGAGAMSKTH